MAPIPIYSLKTNIWLFSFLYHPHAVHQQNTSQIHSLLPNLTTSTLLHSRILSPVCSTGEAPKMSTLFPCFLKFTVCTAAWMTYQEQIRSYHSPTYLLPKASQSTTTESQIEILSPALQGQLNFSPQMSLKSNLRLFASVIFACSLSFSFCACHWLELRTFSPKIFMGLAYSCMEVLVSRSVSQGGVLSYFFLLLRSPPDLISLISSLDHYLILSFFFFYWFSSKQALWERDCVNLPHCFIQKSLLCLA